MLRLFGKEYKRALPSSYILFFAAPTRPPGRGRRGRTPRDPRLATPQVLFGKLGESGAYSALEDETQMPDIIGAMDESPPAGFRGGAEPAWPADRGAAHEIRSDASQSMVNIFSHRPP